MTTPSRRADLGDPVTITVAGRPIQVCPPVKQPVLLFNNSLTEVVYAGYNPNIGIFNSNPIQPLTYVVMEGAKQLYAFCPTASVAITVTPGGTYSSASPAQIAAQIALTGIPVVANPVQVYNAAFTSLPGSNVGVVIAPLNPITVNGQSGSFSGYLAYDVLISLSTVNNAETNPFATIEFDFYENTSDTSPVDSIIWTVAAGFSAGHITNGKGPLRGRYVVVTAFANSASNFAQNLNTFRLLGTGRTVLRDDWRDQFQQNLTTTAKQMTCQPQSNCLGINNLLVVNAGANSVKYTGLFAGDAYLFVNVIGLTTNQLHVQIAAVDGTGANIIDQFIGAATNTEIVTKVTLGRSLYRVSYTNNSGVAATVQSSITALEP